jgi:hypothetical protein
MSECSTTANRRALQLGTDTNVYLKNKVSRLCSVDTQIWRQSIIVTKYILQTRYKAVSLKQLTS